LSQLVQNCVLIREKFDVVDNPIARVGVAIPKQPSGSDLLERFSLGREFETSFLLIEWSRHELNVPPIQHVAQFQSPV
jgi:hypothetical protein